jgi:hypothetical protein
MTDDWDAADETINRVCRIEIGGTGEPPVIEIEVGDLLVLSLEGGTHEFRFAATVPGEFTYELGGVRGRLIVTPYFRSSAAIADGSARLSNGRPIA